MAPVEQRRLPFAPVHVDFSSKDMFVHRSTAVLYLANQNEVRIRAAAAQSLERIFVRNSSRKAKTILGKNRPRSKRYGNASVQLLRKLERLRDTSCRDDDKDKADRLDARNTALLGKISDKWDPGAAAGMPLAQLLAVPREQNMDVWHCYTGGSAGPPALAAAKILRLTPMDAA